jgi:hypothetical protein
MLNQFIKLITAAIIAGIHVNSFCVKHNAQKGALRSMIFKLWSRCKLLASKQNTLTFVVTGRNNRGQLTGNIETIKAAQKALLIPFNVFSIDSFTVAQFKAAGFTVIVGA